uniref:Uncharacterized protein n=1 Tax=Physcomitrium patens TaxID=3218 RepID=A0A7I4AKP3_PHYPA
MFAASSETVVGYEDVVSLRSWVWCVRMHLRRFRGNDGYPSLAAEFMMIKAFSEHLDLTAELVGLRNSF